MNDETLDLVSHGLRKSKLSTTPQQCKPTLPTHHVIRLLGTVFLVGSRASEFEGSH